MTTTPIPCTETHYAPDGLTIERTDRFTLTPIAGSDIGASYLDIMTAQVRQWGQTPYRTETILIGTRPDGTRAFQLVVWPATTDTTTTPEPHPITRTLAIATPDHTWHTEEITLWTDDTDEETLEQDAIAAWVGNDPRTEAVHLWLMPEDDV